MSALIKHRILRCGADSEYVVHGPPPSTESNTPMSPEDEAASIVEQARTEASSMVAEAQREAEGIRERAYQEGWATVQMELDQARLSLERERSEAEQSARQQIAEYWNAVEPDLLKLAVDIARKIVRREIERSDDFILDAVKAGLHQLSDRHELKIRANASDCAYLRERKDELTSSFDGISSLEVIEDRRTGEGGWVVESAGGRLDGRPESQLMEIERALLEASQDAQS